jgi:hypothetical protein
VTAPFQGHLRELPHTPSPADLLLKNLFNLPDFLLDLTGELFDLAFSGQVGVVRDLSRFLLNFAFHFMKLACDLILRARFHVSSCSQYQPSILKAAVYNGFNPKSLTAGRQLTEYGHEMSELSASPPNSGGKGKVMHSAVSLVIDDNPSSVELLSNALAQPGLEILTASNPEEGLNLFRDRHPHARRSGT